MFSDVDLKSSLLQDDNILLQQKAHSWEDAESHLQSAIRQIAHFLSYRENIERLKTAKHIDEVTPLLHSL